MEKILFFPFLFPFLRLTKESNKTPITRTHIKSPPRTFKQRLPRYARGPCVCAGFSHTEREPTMSDLPLRTRRRPPAGSPPAGSPPLQLRQHLWRGSPPSPSRRLLPARLDFPDRQKPPLARFVNDSRVLRFPESGSWNGGPRRRKNVP